MSSGNYIDLFAGAGGLSEGFLRAGFTPLAHVESSEAACFTLKTRAVFHYLRAQGKGEVYNSYLKGEISRQELYDSVPQAVLDTVINAEIGAGNKKIFRDIASLLHGRKVDLIIGGPPCQAYSYIGRAALKHREEDARKTLYIHYGRFLKKYKPKLFVFENVPGLLTSEKGLYFRNLRKYYKRLGYNVDYKLFNAYDFGVVQNRRRLVLIGWRKDISFKYPEIAPAGGAYSRDDIFCDLPPISPNDTARYHDYSAPSNEYLAKSGIRNGEAFVCQHFSRPHNEKDLRIYKLAIKKLVEGERLKNNHIPAEMRTQKNISDFLDRFKVVADTPHTMIAHIAKDGHHFIHPDISQLRSISVREAARIQSFPDNYYFEGVKEDQPRTAAFRQIGNAVPPCMAAAIAEKLKEIIV